MAGRPSKPIHLIKSENKSHYTKAQIKHREEAEAQLLTGVPLQMWPEVKADAEAKKAFNRRKKLLQNIGKDDALYEPVINRYCVMLSEEKRLLCDIGELRESLEGVEDAESKIKLLQAIASFERLLNEKRKMLLQIENNNIMTVSSALRSIPKDPPKKEESPMAEYLKKKSQGC